MVVWVYFTAFHENAPCYTNVHVYCAKVLRDEEYQPTVGTNHSRPDP